VSAVGQSSGSTGDVRLWLVDLERAGDGLIRIETDCPRLSPPDEQRFAALGNRERARHVRAAHIALRLVLEHEVGPWVRRKPYLRSALGQPHLEAGFGEHAVSFSLSHTSGLALIGCGGPGPIGVDLEVSRQLRMSLVRRTLIERAAAALCVRPLPTDGEPRTLQAWVRLEALAKADGVGIGRILTQIGCVGGALKVGAGTPEAIIQALATTHSVEVHDIDAGLGRFAAVAAPEGMRVGSVGMWPTSANEITRLMNAAEGP
jgi:4'-phosphopantetheinyl transferase